MGAVRAYLKFSDAVAEGAGAISKYLVLILVPVGFLNVILRYLGRFTEVSLVNNTWIEAQWYLYGVIFLLMFGYLIRHEINVRVDFWYAEQNQRRRAVIDLIGHLVAMIPFALLGIWISLPRVQTAWEINEQSPDPGGLPRAPIKTFILIGFILLLIEGIAALMRTLSILAGRQEDLGIELDEFDSFQRIE